jgi:hypothetical protein
MASTKQHFGKLFRATATGLSVALLALSAFPQQAASAGWDAVDRRVKSNVYQLNVAIKVKLKDSYAQLADLSPRRQYPVFVTVPQDQGFRVIGHGTCFPVRTSKPDRGYLLTNKHVIDFGQGMLQECQRFFAGTWLYAERSAGFASPETRYKDLLRIVNLGAKKDVSTAERSMYQATVDTIWDTYDEKLSLAKDPKRIEFNRCLAKTGFQGTVGFFIHPPGSSAQPPMVADLYKAAHHANEPDLAILAVKKPMQPLELDSSAPVSGQPIQAVGYPISAKPAGGSGPSYAPSFTNGKIVRVSPNLVHFDATVSKGDSGGPLLNQRGAVIGVVAKRAMPDVSPERYAGAISIKAVKGFAPELFGRN